ncbi:tRNA (adenosine(37)-N6)-threonylcarbamoyltransferase complex ATPase subunit type 1 TsaE [Seonamhaeicola sp. S2-3]|uniref:tRNA (adenosine(37)-N6)-threonylcarbamoyltransferase complex ATPase subunit type 1 TsaE n=1 Tax=Seonamhaeicola sp. S2-3 TaxID=1936081 RepID=UPI000972B8DE|nr:tRNA (adenosine(37)-N6)-threonylcarbamoyltransferase complex ATPase subunit type 1 TsaE [Seonamhaeicola sp. S2-3]APY12870.1 tRNA (adenosine(37)-N6)-threonylcarbamoyltransferase complex ATPase subunit type 1 TsaE [Seonamhaeicola sp. S2-3]
MKLTYTLDNINNVAKEIINNATSKTIFLYGDMGVGKTTLVKSLVEYLGSNEEVSSPTFSIVNEYEAKENLIYHFDLYRINNLEEAFSFGIEDYLYSNEWVIVEWPELIEDIEIEQYNRIEIELNEDNSRTLTLNFKPN